MSGMTGVDVELTARLGVDDLVLFPRRTVGSDVVVYVDVRARLTGDVVTGLSGVSALYHLSVSSGEALNYQPLTPIEVVPGTWDMTVPAVIPGVYTVWFMIGGQAIEVQFHATSVGQPALTSISTRPWGEVQAVGAAAGVSAALPEARRAGAVAGAEAGAEAGRIGAGEIALDAIAGDVQAIGEVAVQVEANRAAIVLDVATATAQRALAELARALAETAALNAGQIAEVTGSDANRQDPLFAIRDVLGNAILALRSSGALGLPAGELAKATHDGLALRDDAGNVAFKVGGQGLQVAGGTLSTAGILTVLSRVLAPLLRAPSVEIAAGGTGLRLLDGAGAAKASLTADAFSFPGGSLSADGILTALLKLALPAATFDKTDTPGLVLRDEAGAVLADLTTGGLRLKGFSVTPAGRMLLGDMVEFRVSGGSNGALRVMDSNGWVAVRLGDDGILRAPVLNSLAPAPTVFTPNEIAEEDARCRAISGEPSRRYRGDLAPLTAQILHFIIYGQSLSVGYEGYPPVTKAQPYDNLMAGLSVHGSASGSTWSQYGAADFNPLIGTVRGGASGVMTPAEIAALPVTGDGSPGETVGEGALNFLRRAYLDAREVEATSATPYTAHRFLAGECGAGGQSIEALSKGDASGLFERVKVMATKVKGIAGGKGLSYGVAAYLWLQGEANYDTSGSNTFDKVAYKALLRKLVVDLHADITSGIAGQARPAAFFTYQTGASYVRDISTSGVAIRLGPSMAQWEVAEEDANVIMVCPQYPVPDKAGHLTANGYRWLGEQFGKVMRKVLLQRQDWRPLCPVRLRVRGRQILVGFNVPAPPLQWGAPYAMNVTTKANVATTYANRGFVVVDDAGAITNATVDLVGDCVVRLTVPRDLVGQVYVRYGGQNTGGQGCLMDSDDTPSSTTFSYLPEDGAGAPDNIPELIGKPYPLNNWCVLFEAPATAA